MSFLSEEKLAAAAQTTTAYFSFLARRKVRSFGIYFAPKAVAARFRWYPYGCRICG